MKLLNALAFALVIPFALFSCKQGAQEADQGAEEIGKGAETEAAAPADNHEAITEEYFGYMSEVMTGMGAVRDKASAEKFIAVTKALKPKLEALLVRAQALPAPTEEQKAAIQANQDKIQEEVKAQQAKMMTENPPSPEEMAELGAIMQEFMGSEFGEQMETVTKGVDAIYGLEN